MLSIYTDKEMLQKKRTRKGKNHAHTSTHTKAKQKAEKQIEDLTYESTTIM